MIGGGGGGGGVVAAAGGGGGGGGGIPLTEVAKHNTKTDCWVVVDGQVLDVTSFLSDHPGGELAILTFAGKDATEEFNMPLDCNECCEKLQLFFFCSGVNAFGECRIHPPDVIGKYAPDSVIGAVGSGVAAAAPSAAPKASGPIRHRGSVCERGTVSR